MAKAYVIGVDFGTDSVRSVLVDAQNGNEISTSVFYYPRWKTGLYCDAAAHQFRQHPLDYMEGLEFSIKECVETAGEEIAAHIKAISIATTGSTPVAVDKTGTPVALITGFEENPNAMFILWKDHTATKEAARINEHARSYKTNYLQFAGGIYSSEWFWAKLLHIISIDPELRTACYSWVEHCDWIPFLLTGGTDVHDMKRSVCAAGHKALWSQQFGGLPPNEFFMELDPFFKSFNLPLFTDTQSSNQSAGQISPEWAQRLHLPATVIIGVGAFDAHMGAVGGQIEPYFLSKVMGTSTCDMLITPLEEVTSKLVKGICGQVPGSIIPGMWGMEAGQSAFGDVYAWFKNLLSWPLDHLIPDESYRNQLTGQLIALLSEEARKIESTENDELAIDWLNGRRTPDANQLLKGAIINLNLATNAPRIFKALVEATCFGAKAIVQRFIEEGVPVKGLIGLGGVAKKSPYIMQTMADIIDIPIRIHRTEQTCAAGAAMFAATAAGIYEKVEDAMSAMGKGFETTYYPDSSKKDIYERRYQRYLQLGEFVKSN